jgi:hypothetical protein
MRFVPFTENNEWEGETWTFWLQLDGNEDELVRLFGKLSAEEFDSYTLDLNTIESEGRVEALEEYANQGYMSSDMVITGTFTCPETKGEDLDRALYKGGIEFMFKDN